MEQNVEQNLGLDSISDVVYFWDGEQVTQEEYEAQSKLAALEIEERIAQLDAQNKEHDAERRQTLITTLGRVTEAKESVLTELADLLLGSTE